MPPEATDMIVVLKPQSEWKTKKSYDELADEISEKLETIPGVFFEKPTYPDAFNELMTGIRQDVAVKIFGENLDSFAVYADKGRQSDSDSSRSYRSSDRKSKRPATDQCTIRPYTYGQLRTPAFRMSTMS